MPITTRTIKIMDRKVDGPFDLEVVLFVDTFLVSDVPVPVLLVLALALSDC